MIKNNVDDVVSIKLTDLFRAEWNAQQESPETFNSLVEEIEEEGFDEPLIVIKHPDRDSGHLIVAGNHRYDAAKVNGMTEVPCIVKDWNENTAKIKSVQRNNLHGTQDPAKMRELINQIKSTKVVSDDALAKAMAYRSTHEFSEIYNVDEIQKKKEEIKKAYCHDDISKELSMVDNMSVLLNNIFSQEHGTSMERGFLFFMHKKKMHLMVTCDDALEGLLSRVVNDLNKDKLDATEVFKDMIIDKLSS